MYHFTHIGVFVNPSGAADLLMIVSFTCNLLLAMLFFYGWIQKIGDVSPDLVDVLSALFATIYALVFEIKDTVHDWIRRRRGPSSNSAIHYTPLLVSTNPDLESGPTGLPQATTEGETYAQASKSPERDVEMGHMHRLQPSEGTSKGISLEPRDVSELNTSAPELPMDVPQVFTVPECVSNCGSSTGYGFGLFAPKITTRDILDGVTTLHDTIYEGLYWLEQSVGSSPRVASGSGQGRVESSLGNGVFLSMPRSKMEAGQHRAMRKRAYAQTERSV